MTHESKKTSVREEIIIPIIFSKKIDNYIKE